MKSFENRKYIISFAILLIGVIFIFRLFYMQIIDDRWKKRAAQISENKITTYPARGIVFDRNKEKLIANVVYYDLMVIPKKVKDIDSVEFSKLIGITIEEYSERMAKAKAYSYRKASEFETQISPKDFDKIAMELYKYQGFYEQERTLRTYPTHIAAHALGYMNEVNSNDIKKNAYYKPRDYIGRSGIEKQYEELLRGKKGVKYYLQDAIGIKTGTYQDGKFDTTAIKGKNITLGLDSKIQAYGEQLMKNKIGSIVAIEPSSGEILAMVTSPSYDPNLLVGRDLGENYAKLQKDSLKPLFNRATSAVYPPGSTFKLVMVLIGLQEGVITENSGFPCTKSLVGCHNHPSAQNVIQAVKMSCNPYFYYVVRRIIQQGKHKNSFKDAAIGLDIWAKYVRSFGLGGTLKTDFGGIATGTIPDKTYYDKIYGEYRWAYSTIYSICIGQGEVLVSPFEMANLAAIMANRGYYYNPHFVKEIEEETLPQIFTKKNYTLVDTSFFPIVVDGMEKVVNESGGTARRAKIDSIIVCGKTGTAQNPHGEDHSIFIAFAPKNNPKIAIAVYVENAGFGGTWAAPIASLMIEKYLTDSISNIKKEQRILDADLIHLNN
ncbi:MAG TPA: penicillin-binding protein 2 [Crocinitomix sp.]|nr:penicillin-binding protein 2 [Crocinitomix sp.]